MIAKKLFDEWPERYDRWFDTPLGNEVFRRERSLILDLLAPGPGERILDAGSGTGIFTREFVDRRAHVVGLDISFSMLRRAKDKYPTRDSREVTADMVNLPFADGVFDKSVSVTAIEFVTDDKRAVTELFRVTKQGGVIVVATLNSLSPWAVQRQATAVRDPDSIFNRVVFRSPAQLLAAAAPAAGIVRTAVHFGKEDPPEAWNRIERAGQGSDSGAFVAARWLKP